MLCLKYVHVGKVFDHYEEFKHVFVHFMNALGVGNDICIEWLLQPAQKLK